VAEQGWRKVLKTGGARLHQGEKRENFRRVFVSFSQKIGGARAPCAPPVPPPLQKIYVPLVNKLL